MRRAGRNREGRRGPAALFALSLVACAAALCGRTAASTARAARQSSAAHAQTQVQTQTRAQGQTPTPTQAGEPASIRLTVVDKGGRPLEGLRKEDVRLSEGGAALEVLGLERRKGEPLALALMLDASASQETLLPTAKEAAQRFVESLIRPGADAAAVYTFTGELRTQQDFTDDRALLLAAIGRARFEPPPGFVRGGIIVGGPPPKLRDPAFVSGATALWDSLASVAAEMSAKTRTRPDARRVIVVVTDGVDTSSRTKRDEAIRQAVAAGAAVYAVGVGDARSYDGVDKSELSRLAERTGGRAVFPKKAKDLLEVFPRLGEELSSEYVLTFRAPNNRPNDAARRLRLEIVNPELRRQDLQLAYPR